MAKIVIDAGHGGDDPGASGNGIIEKDLTLKISQYMYDRFRDLGIPVKMTRTTDETISPTERVKRVLDAYGNSNDVIVISNHINAGGGDGAEVIYPLRSTSTLPNLILEQLSKEGQNIRKAYQRRLPSDTSKDYYFMQRNTGDTQSLTVEYGFLDSTKDDVQQLKNNYEDFAEAVVRAVAEYANLSYIPKEGGNTYTVKSGDSLWSIAKKYNVSVDELKKANNLTSNVLRINQVLFIPTKKEEESGNYIVYTVKSGDTLYSIAKNYNIAVSDIIELNKLSNNILNLGQRLLLPVEEKVIETKYNTYVVKSGDTLYSVAKNYGISVTELKEINDLSNNTLSIGQKLLVPATTIIIDETTPGEYITYTVKSGDNLYSIANRYGVSVKEIMNLNNLTSNLLNVGQTLRIPTSETNTYIVKSGDNLYSIARRYNTTVDAIKRKNNLVSNNLSIGQSLII